MNIQKCLFLKSHITKHLNVTDCPAARKADETLETYNTRKEITEPSYTEALKIEYVCKDDYEKLYLGDFVYECQDDGTWNNENVLQCVNSQLLFF